MKAVALFLPEMDAGGAQRAMLLLAEYLVARGFRVQLVLAIGRGPNLQEVPPGVELVDLGGSKTANATLFLAVGSILRLAKYLRSARPDALVSSITGANLAAILARLLSRVSCRLIARETVTLENVTSPFRRWSMRLLYPFADVLVVLTRVMRDQFSEQLGMDVSRIVVIENTVDGEKIRQKSQEPLDNSWLESVSSGVGYISVGRLIRQKNHARLIRSFALLVEKCPDSWLAIVGDGPCRADLERLISNLNLSQHVILVGFDANPWRWMARAKVFVLSSDFEGYPNVLNEARAMGMPIVVTEYDGSVREVAGNAAFVVPLDDDIAMVKAMREASTSTGEVGFDMPYDANGPLAAYEALLTDG